MLATVMASNVFGAFSVQLQEQTLLKIYTLFFRRTHTSLHLMEELAETIFLNTQTSKFK